MHLFKFLPLVAAASATAATVTFNGTISDGPDHMDESISVTFVTSDNPAAYQATPYSYQDVYYLNKDLFASISGTGFTGTWTRPFDPFSFVLRDTRELTIVTMNGTGGSIGPSFFGNPLYYLSFSFATVMPDDIGTDYSTLFTGAFGTYSEVGGGGGCISLLNGNTYSLNLYSVTIGEGTAVPEPSTYGLIGIGALGVAFAARRRKIKYYRGHVGKVTR